MENLATMPLLCLLHLRITQKQMLQEMKTMGNEENVVGASGEKIPKARSLSAQVLGMSEKKDADQQR